MINFKKIFTADIFGWLKKKPEPETKVKTGGLPFTVNTGKISNERQTMRIGRIKDALDKMERRGIDNPDRKEKLEMELKIRELALQAAKLQSKEVK